MTVAAAISLAVFVVAASAVGGGTWARAAETTTTSITGRPNPPGPPTTRPTPPSTDPPPPPTTAPPRGSARRRMTVRISNQYVVTAAVTSTAGRPVRRDLIAFRLSGRCGTLTPTASRTGHHGVAATGYSPGRAFGNCRISASDSTGANASTVYHNRPCHYVFQVAVSAQPSSLPADGTSAAAVSAWVGDCGGIYGTTVTFDLSGAACGSISPRSGTTDFNGYVRATYQASTTAGDCILRAWVGSQYGGATISQAGEPAGQP